MTGSRLGRYPTTMPSRKRKRETGEGEAKPWSWHDIFCGGGVGAYGARAAGFEVVCGMDNDADAIAAFKRNHEAAEAKTLHLGPKRKVPWPEAKARMHVHLSPPCSDLSNAKAGSRDESGALLLRWSIKQAVAHKYASWTVETVVSPETKPIVASLMQAHPKQVASAHVDAANLGAPQSRVRLIVGPPALIDRLRRTPCPPRLSIRNAYEAAGRPLCASYVKNHSIPPALRSVQDVALTVVASRAPIWCDYDATTVRCMGSEDSRILMGLDEGYKLCGTHYVDQRVLGNGMCFHMARAIAQAACAFV